MDFTWRLAIKKFTRRNIIQSHQLKLPGDNEDRELYFRLACIADAEMPSFQRFSDTGRCIRNAISSTFGSSDLKDTGHRR
mmetsp:Transcript_13002/g.23540  ORF Transcript_13002/g.23540 Transcript_13002/m.23540 type:complete len:80 (-) Transcript_13002:585-824(-)